jgi:cytochrome oxidase Cu insertion factor (SCO1/SenC/PrrC family)
MHVPALTSGMARLRLCFWLAALLTAGVGAALLVRAHQAHQIPGAQAVPGQALMGGTALTDSPAPDFTLTDQFGRPVSLRQERGKVVFLAFVDSQCTTICPLTTQSLVDALQLLGPAAGRVALLGVDANPEATTVADVRAYSQVHGLLNAWDFGTGSAAQLQAVWTRYHVASEIVDGTIDHTPALYVIDQQGHERYLYLTPMQYAALPQEAAILAGDASRLLPGHPKVLPTPLATGPTIAASTQPVTLPLLAGAGRPVRLGPGTARLVVFWASWVPDAPGQLRSLDAYANVSLHAGLPPHVAVDVGDTEATPQMATDLLRQAGALAYPVALDSSGAVADAYGAQDLPWLALTDAQGRVRWSHDGRLGGSGLATAVQTALRTPPTPGS